MGMSARKKNPASGGQPFLWNKKRTECRHPVSGAGILFVLCLCKVKWQIWVLCLEKLLNTYKLHAYAEDLCGLL